MGNGGNRQRWSYIVERQLRVEANNPAIRGLAKRVDFDLENEESKQVYGLVHTGWLK